MERVRKFIVTHLWWVVLVVALAMLFSHSFGVRGVVVDNISLILLALVLISPFVAAIKKVKIGEFEAEIEPEEVKRVAQQAEKSLPTSEPTPSLVPEISKTVAAITSLAETDPVVALAKLRIELENRLRRIHQRADSHAAVRKRSATLSYLIHELVTREVFSQDFGESLLDVISICNRAIHGEDIRDVDARQIINIGSDLLEFLERTVHDYAATHPLEKKVITPLERDEFQSGRYRLTTVVPYVDNPEQRVYVLDQDELDAFIEGYSEFAEFMVRLEKVE